jgi:4-amino-4-deoxy-L-arabinose transferase-like glycosyltransferase
MHIKQQHQGRHPGFLVLALLPVLFTLYSTWPLGLALSPDSVDYLAAARSLGLGRGFIGSTGEQITSWPPLCPSILALFQQIGLSPLGATRIFNALLWGGTTLLAALWIASVTRSTALALLAALWIALSPMLLLYASMLWSEPLFVALVVAALYALTRCLAAPSWTNVILAAVLAGAATQQRYAGGIAVIVGTFGLMFLRRDVGFLRRIPAAFVYGLVASVPTAIWLVRNLRISGTLTGERLPSIFGPREIIAQSLSSIGETVLPSRLQTLNEAAGAVILLAVVAAPLLVWLRRRTDRPLLMSSIVLSLFVLVYTVFIMVVAERSNTCCVDRFLGVNTPLLAIQGAFIAHALVGASTLYRKRALALAFLLALSIPATRTVVATVKHATINWGYHVGQITMFREHALPPDALVYSNLPEVAWVEAGVDYVKFSPMLGRYSSTVVSSTMPAFRAEVGRDPGRPAFLVWFREKGRDYLHTLEDIRREAQLEPLGEREGVMIFRIAGLRGPERTGQSAAR